MDENNINVPYTVFEGEMARSERHIKRLWIALVLCVLALFGTNAGWLIYESQFETYTYEYSQDGDGLNNINTGEQGDVFFGPETEGESP